MGILDDAIKEHLELKRQHGAEAEDLQKLESEAFGPADDSNLEAQEIPNEVAEAETQFMQTHPGEAPTVVDAPFGVAGAEAEVADTPDTDAAPDIDAGPESEAAAEPEAVTDADAPPVSGAIDIPAPPPRSEAPAPGQPDTMEHAILDADDEDEPLLSEPDAMEHQIISAPAPGDPEPPPSPEPESQGPSTEERHAISEHPTELYDVAAELSADEESPSVEVSQPGPADNSPASEEPPSFEEDQPVDIGAEAELALGEEEDDFFSEQSLSDELDQALDSPAAPEPEPDIVPEQEPEVAAEQEPEPPAQASAPDTEVYELESEPASEPEAHDDEPERATFIPPEPASAPEPDDREPEPRAEPAPEPEPGGEPSEGGGNFYNVDEDVLEETPDFLQDTPEHDRLWFEQKPPKDFDFDD